MDKFVRRADQADNKQKQIEAREIQALLQAEEQRTQGDAAVGTLPPQERTSGACQQQQQRQVAEARELLQSINDLAAKCK
jgi:hypothetical protein